MKKQFAIKAIQTTKANLLSIAKNESTNILKLSADTEDTVCCPWLSRIQGLAPKPALAL